MISRSSFLKKSFSYKDEGMLLSSEKSPKGDTVVEKESVEPTIAQEQLRGGKGKSYGDSQNWGKMVE